MPDLSPEERELVRAAERYHRERALSPDEEELKRFKGMRVSEVRQHHWNRIIGFAGRMMRERDAARLAQPEAEREGTHRIEAVRWSRSNDEELDGNVYGEPVTLLIVKGHIGPTGWDDAVRVVRAAPPPTDREGAKDG